MSTEPAPLRRAVLLMTASSVLVPVAGLLTQPILARGLGTDGRGELAAALAPAVLLGAIATLGLPDALTYLTARSPRRTRSAVGWSVMMLTSMGLLCVAATFLVAPFLANGQADLQTLIILSMVLWIPVLLVGALRGAARGLQEWTVSALESVVNMGLRLIGLFVLWFAGNLTVLTALLVTALSQALAGAVYLPLLKRRRVRGRTDLKDSKPPRAGDKDDEHVARQLVRYGTRVWFGSIASMLVARTGQVLMIPLSNTEELGLLTVAVTISDVPIIVAMAISGALQGVNSRSNDVQQIARTTRVTVAVGAVACIGLAAVTPLAVPLLFGPGFEAAVLPTLVLLLGAVLCVPGFMAGAGLAAMGRPALRSLAFICTFLVNLVAFVLLVPTWGALGAAWANTFGNLIMSVLMVVALTRTTDLSSRDLTIPRREDVTMVVTNLRQLLGRVRSRRRI